MPETQQPLRRDMSYRKPVPKFVPSPTPAPPSLPPSPTPQKFSMSVEYVMCDEMPPLPPGWRDAINRATSKDKWSFSGFRNDMNMGGGNYSNEKTTQKEQVSFPQVSGTPDSGSLSEYGEEALVTPPMSPVPWVQSPRASRKGTLPVVYRPPTPPIPAYVKKERLPTEESTNYLTAPKYYHTIYPDPPSLLENNEKLGDPEKIANLNTNVLNIQRPELSPGTSFATAMSQPSVAVFSSFTEADSLSLTDPSLRDTWYILPANPHGTDAFENSQDTMSREKSSQYTETSYDACGVWGHLGMLGNMLRTRLRSLRVV